MSDDVPRHQLLLKLLRMTTSDNDAEALVAVRKANGVLRDAGWDWERLLAGRITVIGDPFAGLDTPTSPKRAPAPPKWGPTPPSPPPPPPQPAMLRTPVHSGNLNRFPGFCYCCGVEIIAGAGYLFNATNYHPHAISKSTPICATCNSSTTITIPSRPVPRKQKRGRVSIDSLA